MGDWTTNIKPSLLDKLLGQEVSFLKFKLLPNPGDLFMYS